MQFKTKRSNTLRQENRIVGWVKKWKDNLISHHFSKQFVFLSFLDPYQLLGHGDEMFDLKVATEKTRLKDKCFNNLPSDLSNNPWNFLKLTIPHSQTNITHVIVQMCGGEKFSSLAFSLEQFFSFFFLLTLLCVQTSVTL